MMSLMSEPDDCDEVSTLHLSATYGISRLPGIDQLLYMDGEIISASNR